MNTLSALGLSRTAKPAALPSRHFAPGTSTQTHVFIAPVTGWPVNWVWSHIGAPEPVDALVVTVVAAVVLTAVVVPVSVALGPVLDVSCAPPVPPLPVGEVGWSPHPARASAAAQRKVVAKTEAAGKVIRGRMAKRVPRGISVGDEVCGL